jgi:hypothetical protein
MSNGPSLKPNYTRGILVLSASALTTRAAERGGAGGQIAPGPQVAPRIFLLGPSHFFGWNISAQRARYLFFWAKYRNLVWKIEVRSLESNYNVLVRKNVSLKSCRPGGGGCCCCLKKYFSGKKIWNRGPKKICPGPPPSSRRPCLRLLIFEVFCLIVLYYH